MNFMKFQVFPPPLGVPLGLSPLAWGFLRFLQNSTRFQGFPGNGHLDTLLGVEVSMTRVMDSKTTSHDQTVHSPANPWNRVKFCKNLKNPQARGENPKGTPRGGGNTWNFINFMNSNASSRIPPNISIPRGIPMFPRGGQIDQLIDLLIEWLIGWLMN